MDDLKQIKSKVLPEDFPVGWHDVVRKYGVEPFVDFVERFSGEKTYVPDFPSLIKKAVKRQKLG